MKLLASYSPVQNWQQSSDRLGSDAWFIVVAMNTQIEQIQRACDIIRANPEERHTLGALAGRVGLSRFHFQRAFTQVVGHFAARLCRSLPARAGEDRAQERRAGHAGTLRRGLRIEQPAVRARGRGAGHDAGDVPQGRSGRRDRFHDCRVAVGPAASGRNRTRRVSRDDRRQRHRSRARSSAGISARDRSTKRSHAQRAGAHAARPFAGRIASCRPAARRQGDSLSMARLAPVAGDSVRRDAHVSRGRGRDRQAVGDARGRPRVRHKPGRPPDSLSSRHSHRRLDGRLSLGNPAEAETAGTGTGATCGRCDRCEVRRKRGPHGRSRIFASTRMFPPCPKRDYGTVYWLDRFPTSRRPAYPRHRGSSPH